MIKKYNAPKTTEYVVDIDSVMGYTSVNNDKSINNGNQGEYTILSKGNDWGNTWGD